MAFVTAVNDLFFGKPVPLRVGIAGAQPAVQTVVFAVTGKLDKAAHKNVIAVYALRR
jgi:hypothetical protein